MFVKKHKIILYTLPYPAHYDLSGFGYCLFPDTCEFTRPNISRIYIHLLCRFRWSTNPRASRSLPSVVVECCNSGGKFESSLMVSARRLARCFERTCIVKFFV